MTNSMIKTEKIILTDCDGVLLAWEGAFHDWMISKGFTIKEKAIYDISKTFGICMYNEGKKDTKAKKKLKVNI